MKMPDHFLLPDSSNVSSQARKKKKKEKKRMQDYSRNTLEAGYNNVGYNEVPNTAKRNLVPAKLLCVIQNLSDFAKSDIM